MWNKKSAKLFLTPTVGRELVLKRAILQIMGEVRGKLILDLGCGSGYWTRIFQSRGAKCIGIDRSPEQIALAKSFNTPNITYVLSEAATFRSKKKFDIVFIDHIISETSSRKKSTQILKAARRMLKKGGFVILNEMHPSVAHFPGRKLKTKGKYFYFRSGAPFTFKVKLSDGKHITLRDYHWTLEDFSSFLQKAGFSILSITEPQPQNLKSLNMQLRNKYQYPSHIIIKAAVNQ